MMKRFAYMVFIVATVAGGVFFLVRQFGTEQKIVSLPSADNKKLQVDDSIGIDPSLFRHYFKNWLNYGASEREKSRSNTDEEGDFDVDNTQVEIPDTQKNDERRRFSDQFDDGSAVEEVVFVDDSSHERWWLSSGGRMLYVDGAAQTIHGSLTEQDPWRKKYEQGLSSLPTDDGKHPQNIFRLVQRDVWQDYVQEAYFRIDRYVISEHEGRQSSNGIFLFNRYYDSDNLYYVGLRVDGNIVIKKKKDGEYYVLSTSKIIDGEYDRDTRPNLLSENTWIGIRSVVENIGGGSVSIKVYVDRDLGGNWVLVGSATDGGEEYGGAALIQAGHAGLRTDFMDVSFDNYRIQEL